MFILLVLVTGVSAFTTPTVVHTGRVSESPISSGKHTGEKQALPLGKGSGVQLTISKLRIFMAWQAR